MQVKHLRARSEAGCVTEKVAEQWIGELPEVTSACSGNREAKYLGRGQWELPDNVASLRLNRIGRFWRIWNSIAIMSDRKDA